jgi:arginyl-tRNA synthetase
MKYPLEKAQEEIKSALQAVLSQLSYNIDIRLEIPPEGLGDFAFPCFDLAPLAKKTPSVIAENIAKKIKKTSWIEKVEPRNGYVNFLIAHKKLVHATLQSILNKKERYGNLKKKDKKVIIEHTSANPNGPLHVGRARNPIIGDTLVRIYKAAGFEVESQFYLDDMGKQVATLAWGINNLSSEDVPRSDYKKPDHQIVGFYQEASRLMNKDEKVAAEISDIVRKSERGDQKILERVHEAYYPVLQGIQESLERINITIDHYVPESRFVMDKSVDVVVKQLKESIYCSEEDGAFYLDLTPFGVQGRNTKFFFTRKDGTTLYATRDIAYHLWKIANVDVLINILGEDHKLESQQVEIALNILKAKHLPKVIFYSFVSLPGGKMSTRKGRAVFLDDLVDECIKRAYVEVQKRRGSELSEEKMDEIARVVGVGALRYNIIKVQPEKGIVFKWSEALNFEGNAAPFIQYAHARAQGILSKKRKNEEAKNADYTALYHNSEIRLVKKLARFPIIIEEAYMDFKPHIVATYLYETAAQFNQFYRDCPVLSEKDERLRKARLALVTATAIVLSRGLEILGIVAPEEM